MVARAAGRNSGSRGENIPFTTVVQIVGQDYVGRRLVGSCRDERSPQLLEYLARIPRRLMDGSPMLGVTVRAPVVPLGIVGFLHENSTSSAGIKAACQPRIIFLASTGGCSHTQNTPSTYLYEIGAIRRGRLSGINIRGICGGVCNHGGLAALLR